ncbi:MAG TPA: chalcone isomerase family protein [Thermoanaerobaculia bacterium]
MRSLTTRLVLAATLTLASVSAFAATVGGAKLEDSVTVNGQNLVLNGAGLRKKLFIKVYAAGLYLPAKSNNATAILAADQPRRLVMHFVYDVDKAKIAEAWSEGLAANSANASAEVKSNFQKLSSWMEDVKSGQRIVMTYVPGTGTTVEVNGKTKGTLAGKATADAILSTWIGAKPGPGEDFKQAVLGK